MKRVGGFTLLELLVVMTVIVLMVTLMVPAFQSFGRANTLSAAGQSVVDTLNFARQTALTKSRPVEVRFYELPDELTGSGNPTDYRGMQLFVIESTNTNVLSKPIYFPAPVVMSQNLTTTSLMNGTNCPELTAGPSDLSLPGIGRNYRYRKFTFKTDGSTDLTLSDSWFLSLYGKTDPATRPSGLPPNFITVQIDPQNGKTRAFQP